jgi:hypothetical protein
MAYAYYPNTVGDRARTPIHIQKASALMCTLQNEQDYISVVQSCGDM